MSKVTFNGLEKLIIVNDGVTTLSVIRDLYSEWKKWFKSGTNSKFLPAMRSVGGDPISDVKDLGATFFLINGWRIRPFEGDHRLIIQGNLFTDPAGDSIVTDTIGDWRIVIEMETSSLVDSTIQQLPQIEYASFNGGITVDEVNGVSGIAFPRGTPHTPVNNLTDALSIANNRGFKTIYVLGQLSLNTGLDYSNFTFSASSYINNRLLVMAASNTTGAVFRSLDISGELDGGNELTNCVIENIVYVNGYIENCSLIGNIFLDGGSNAVINNCITADPYNPPVIDMGGTGQNLAMAKYSGIVTITNLTGDNFVGIDLSGGRIILDSNTVTNGTVHVSGVGELLDENGDDIESGEWNGVDIINQCVSNDSVSSAVWNAQSSKYLTDGSTGRALSDAGSAGNPWSSPIEGNQQPGTFGELVSKKLLTFAKWIGLR